VSVKLWLLHQTALNGLFYIQADHLGQLMGSLKGIGHTRVDFKPVHCACSPDLELV